MAWHCVASSRVGVMISMRVAGRRRGRYSSRSSVGSRNAAVLPLPVCALAQMSRPCMASGMQRRCGPRAWREQAQARAEQGGSVTHLNGCGLLVAQRSDGAQQRAGEVQVRERYAHRRFGSRVGGGVPIKVPLALALAACLGILLAVAIAARATALGAVCLHIASLVAFPRIRRSRTILLLIIIRIVLHLHTRCLGRSGTRHRGAASGEVILHARYLISITVAFAVLCSAIIHGL